MTLTAMAFTPWLMTVSISSFCVAAFPGDGLRKSRSTPVSCAPLTAPASAMCQNASGLLLTKATRTFLLLPVSLLQPRTPARSTAQQDQPTKWRGFMVRLARGGGVSSEHIRPATGGKRSPRLAVAEVPLHLDVLVGLAHQRRDVGQHGGVEAGLREILAREDLRVGQERPAPRLVELRQLHPPRAVGRAEGAAGVGADGLVGGQALLGRHAALRLALGDDLAEFQAQEGGQLRVALAAANQPLRDADLHAVERPAPVEYLGMGGADRREGGAKADLRVGDDDLLADGEDALGGLLGARSAPHGAVGPDGGRLRRAGGE